MNQLIMEVSRGNHSEGTTVKMSAWLAYAKENSESNVTGVE